MLAANAEGIPRTGFVRKGQVLKLFGISESTLRRRMKVGVIPGPIEDNAVGGDWIKYWDAERLWAIHDRMLGRCEDVQKTA